MKRATSTSPLSILKAEILCDVKVAEYFSASRLLKNLPASLDTTGWFLFYIGWLVFLLTNTAALRTLTHGSLCVLIVTGIKTVPAVLLCKKKL